MDDYRYSAAAGDVGTHSSAAAAAMIAGGHAGSPPHAPNEDRPA